MQNKDLRYFITIFKEKPMAHVITKSDCINCGACEPVCPVTCITEKDDARIIDGEACIDCGACVDECPVSCIAPE